jgi:hypothetical protein
MLQITVRIPGFLHSHDGVHPYRKTKRAGRGRATVAASADGRKGAGPKRRLQKRWPSSILHTPFSGIRPE